MGACVIAARASVALAASRLGGHISKPPKRGPHSHDLYHSCACIIAVRAHKLGQDSSHSCVNIQIALNFWSDTQCHRP